MSSSNYFSKIHTWRILAFCLAALVSTASILATVTIARAAILALPVISATKSDAIIDDGVPLAEAADGKADPGETIEYTVVINNSGPDDATGLTYTDTIDPNTTLSGSASVSPVAINDTLPVTVTGNVAISTALMASPFSVVTNDYPGQNMSPGLTIVGPATFLSAQGGNVNMTLSGANIGQFTYDPPAGFEGTDTFTYTLSDNANASSAASNRTATVTINVGGMIWFVNNNALACTVDGCGRLSNPYSTLAAFSSANNGTGNYPAANDNIFIYESATSYTGGITLLSGQKLIGQDSTQSLAAITGLSPVTGSLTLPAMNATPAQFTTLQNAGGNGVTLNTGNTLNGFTAGNASGSAIFGSGFGTLTAADVIVNSNGQALNLTNGTLSAIFPSVTSTGGTNNVALTGPLTGTLTMSAGALSGATGNAFNMNGGSATINNAATIASGSARSVNVTGLTGGIVTFSGAITDTDTGISLTTNTGATINFTGALTLSTGANTAFNATGGGTISATNATSTATTTTATAVNVANTIIGASNLTFRSVSSVGGSASGIILTSTGSTGSLVVAGDGTTTKGGNGSGGTITNKTGGADGNGATSSGVYINNASAILRNMTLTRFDNYGVYGLAARNVTVQYSTVGAISGAACADGDGDIGTSSGSGDAALVFGISNPGGSNGFTSGGTLLLDNLNVYCSIEHQVEIYQQSGSFAATISNSDIKDASTLFGGDGVQAEMQGTASAVITVDNVSFDDNKSQAVQAAANDSSTLDMTVRDSDIVRSSQGNEGIIMSNGSNGDLIAHITGNNISGVQGATIFVGQTPGNATAASSLTAYIANNIINHPTTAVNSAILVWTTSTIGAGAPANVMVTNNTITQNSTSGVSRGIFVDTPDAGTNPNFSVTVLSNIVHIQDNVAGLHGIVVQGRQSSNACFDVRSNTVDFPNGVPAGINGIRIRQANTATVNLEQGGSAGAPAVVLAANNTSTAESVGVVGVVGNSTCANPPVSFSPNRTGTIAQAQPNTSIDAVSVAPVSVEKLASNGALGSVMKHDLPARSTAANVSTNPGGGKPLFALAQPAPALSGETVTLNIGTLPAGKSVTISFRATVDALDPGEVRTRILNQGTVETNELADVLTTDPSPDPDPACATAGTQTCTPVDRPDTTVTSLTRQSANPNKNASVTWQIVFAEPVAGLANSNFSLVSGGAVSGAAITSVTETSGPPSTTWNITATTGTGDGTLELRMASDTGLSHDVTNQPYTEPASGAEYTIDKTAPTVTINQAVGQSDPTNGSPINFTVVFSEDVGASFATGDVTLSGAAGATTGTVSEIIPMDGTTYNVAVSGMTSDGAVIASILVNQAQDLAGNTNVASTSGDNTVTYDATAPTVTINQAVGQSDPTGSSPINFTVVFSEDVGTSFATGDVSLSGAAGATTGTVSEIVPMDGTTYNVAVSGMTNDGAVIVSILANQAQDLAGNTNTASTSSDNTVTYDATAPTVTINQAVGQSDPTGSSPINFTVVFSEDVGASFATGDVTLSGAAGATTETVSETAPMDGTTYNVAVSGMTNDGAVIVSILANQAQDLAGNDNTASTSSDNTVTYDGTQPTVTINQAVGQSDPTGSSPINFTVVFSEDVGTSFATGDVSLSGTAGATTGTVSETAPMDGTTYNVAVSGMTSDGTVIASILANQAQDLSGNTNLASTSSDNSVVYDTVAPSVTINQAVAQTDPTNNSPINFTVVFSEAVTDFDDAADVSLSGTAGATTSLITGGPTTYNVAVSGMTGVGTIIASIPAGVAVDVASQPNSISTSTDNTVTYDNSLPDTTIDSNPANPTTSANANFTFSGSDTGSGVASFECNLDAGGFGACTSPQGYTGLSDGSHTFEVRAIDNTGNVDATPASYTWGVDTTAPNTTITNDPVPTGLTNATGVTFNFAGDDGSGVGGLTFECRLDTAPYGACNGGSISYSGLSDGSHTFYVYATDSLGNADATPATYTWTVDTVVPSVILSSLVTSPTNNSPILVTITFSEPVDIGTGAGDLNITNSPADPAISGGPTVYTFNLTPGADGPVTAQYLAIGAVDMAGNANTASNIFSITYDSTAPTVTIDQASGQPDPTNASPVNFTVIFSEAATDFDDAADVILTGTAGATTAAITGGPTTYNVAVSGMTSSGTVIATIPAGVALDLAENTNIASTSTDNEVNYIYDVDPPVVVSSIRTDPNPTAAASVSYTVTFSEPVSGVDAADFALNTTGTISGVAVTGVSGTGTTYAVTVSTGTGTGTLRLDIPATATIVDLGANPLSGLPYLGGEAYTVRVPDFGKTAPTDGAASQSLSPTLSWQASYGATSYEYCYSSAPGPCTKWNSVGTDTSVALSGLAANYTYYWQVRAVNAGGTTEANSGTWWSFTTTTTAACTWPAYTPPTTATFGDVPMDAGHWSWVERLVNATITSGCGAGNYCPYTEINRAQTAIFLLRGKHCGSAYIPPAVGASTGFGDVPLDATYAPWVKQLAAEGITAGCGGGNFCPLQVVSRAQMAIFLLRAKHGATYSPPAIGTSTGFADVPLDAAYAVWVKQLAVDGITAGCGGGNFCPLDPVNRAQMATFLVRAFGLP